jgi:cytochrome c peroxidase
MDPDGNRHGHAVCHATISPNTQDLARLTNDRGTAAASGKDVNAMMMASDGPIKTFPLRGVKDTPPYLHDGRVLTLEDTVEYFNLVLDRKLTEQEKTDVVAFLRTL